MYENADHNRDCTSHPVWFKISGGPATGFVVDYSDGTFELYRRATRKAVIEYANKRIECAPEWVPCK